jgi:hypothetical protein
MSWSLVWVGTPEKIIAALDKESDRLTGQSKEEFDKVKPALVTLVEANYDKTVTPALKLSANGHGYIENGEPKYSACNVSLENMGAALV